MRVRRDMENSEYWGRGIDFPDEQETKAKAA
jgi:hypothetical protein